MKNPESYLRILNKKLLRLINYVDILDFGKKNELDNLKMIFRKTCVSQFLYDRYVISIAGLQGAGKTMIINQLYGLKRNEYLPENIGTGEQIPVLISENDENKIKTIVNKLVNDNHEIKFIPVETSSSDFKNISMHPSNDDIFLELSVPSKYFNGLDISFLLLPGFEENNDKDYWQFLTNYSLLNSASFAFVIDESRYAKEYNKKKIDDFLKEFEGSKPIFLISKSDISSDQNKSLSESLFLERKFDTDERDRIICTGDSDELRSQWIPQFINSINKYRNISSINRNKKNIYLKNILDDELFTIIDAIEEKSNRNDMNEYIQFNKKLNRILLPLKKSIDDLRKKYSKKLEDSLKYYIVKPQEDMRKFIADKDYFKKFKILLFGTNINDLSNFENKIKEYWENSNNYTVDDVWLKVTTEIGNIQKILITGDNNIEKYKLRHLNDEDKEKLTIYNDKIFDKNIIENLEILFNKKNGNLEFSDEEFKTSLLPAIEILPSLILENIRILRFFPTETKAINERDNRENINSVMDEFNFSMSINAKIISSFGVILGIDGAADGKIDSLPNLFSALGIHLSERAGQIVSAAAASIGVAMLIQSIIISLNKMDNSQVKEAKAIFEDLKQKTLDLYLNQYDDIMNFFMDFITNRIKESYHIDNNYSRKINLDKIISDIKEIRINIKEKLNEDIGLLGE